MINEKKLRARILCALNATVVITGLDMVACGDSGDSEQSLESKASCPTAEVTCWPPGQTHFNVGNVPPDAQISTPSPIFDANGCQIADQVADGCCNSAAAGPELRNGQCCYAFCTGACCGRPLVINGVLCLPPIERRADWGCPVVDGRFAEGLSASARAAITAEWLADAQMEHASIASFARFVMDLLAFAAPPEIVADAHRAGLDEVEHARKSFAVAGAYAGAAFGPGALKLDGARASVSLKEAAISAFREGCVGETTAALLAAERARAAQPAAIRSVLSTIAAEEARHAELAFRFVVWAVEHGGPEVREGIAKALGELELPRTFGEECKAYDPILRAHGRLSEPEIRQIERRALLEVVVPCGRALLECAAERAVRSFDSVPPRRETTPRRNLASVDTDLS